MKGIKIRAVLVDDEVANRNLIRRMLNEISSEIEIVGEANDVSSGYKLISTTKPELVFLDIKMLDGTGFDLLEKFEKIVFEVVFISAFDNYALKAFEFNALDYVLKPIDAEKLKKTVTRVLNRLASKVLPNENTSEAFGVYERNTMIMNRIPIHSGNKVDLVKLSELVFLESKDGYTILKKSDGNSVVSSRKLSEFEFIFEKFPNFLKISKGTIVNLSYVLSYSKKPVEEIHLMDGTTMVIARRKKKEVLDILIATGKK